MDNKYVLKKNLSFIFSTSSLFLYLFLIMNTSPLLKITVKKYKLLFRNYNHKFCSYSLQIEYNFAPSK